MGKQLRLVIQVWSPLMFFFRWGTRVDLLNNSKQVANGSVKYICTDCAYGLVSE